MATPEFVYQFTVPALEVAAKVTDPEPQRDAGVVPVMVGVVFTVIAPDTELVTETPLELDTTT